MALEIYGMITHQSGERDGRTQVAEGPIDLQYLRDHIVAHEEGGFDRVLVGYGTHGPDGFGLIGYGVGLTERLGFLLAHRPGFVNPTLAARKLATLDQISKGRLAIHVITARDNAVAADGDFLDKEDRYRRTDEYITVLKKVWGSAAPFDHEGEFYHITGGYSAIKPFNGSSLPISFGGSSAVALEIAARQADTWAFYGEPLEGVREQSAEIKTLAAAAGRDIKIHVSLRVILGATEEKAWDRAFDIAERVKARRNGVIPQAASRGAQRLQEWAAQGDVFDQRLFFGVSRYVGDGGNSSALVGTPEQVAESMLAYYDAGVSKLLIRGFDPLQDTIDYGRDLLPLVRAEAAKRDRELAATTS